MYLADTHVHSIFSFDGEQTMESVLKKAIYLNLKYIAFTEHVDMDKISLRQAINRYKVYEEEINSLQEKYPNIKIIKGMEFSNPEKYKTELIELNKLNLDYIIGSNHIFPKEFSKEGILNYYKNILESVKFGYFDTLGHIDYIKKFYDDSFITNDIYEEIFYYMIKNNISLEINTSAKRRIKTNTFPNEKIINLYKGCGGKTVTFGSDAHRLNELYDNVENNSDKYNLVKGIYLNRKFKYIK